MKELNNSNEKKTNGTTDSNIIGYGVKRRKASQRSKTSDTFWNLLRIKNDMQLSDLADVTGFKVYRISNCFTGRDMPNDTEIKVFCDWFGVPFEKGKLEFKNGYTVYHGGHGTINKEPRKATQSTIEDVQEYTKKETSVSNENKYEDLEKEARNIYYQDVKDLNKDAVMAILFYELSYEEYKRIETEYETTDPEMILRGLYKNASFETFMRIARIFKAF